MIDKHWISHVDVVFYIFLLVLFTGAAFYGALTSGNELLVLWALVLLPLVDLFLLLGILIHFINDELDLFVVTDQRIVDITQVQFLHREVSEANLNQIQDVRGSMKGILGTIFNVGTIHIQTAARTDNFMIDYVHNPVAKARHVLDYSNSYRKSISGDQKKEPEVKVA